MEQENELDVTLMGITAGNPWHANDNANREHMQSVQLGQRLVIAGSSVRRWQTGVERDWGQYTFGVKMPVNARIIAVVPRYPVTLGSDAIRHNPQTVVVYEDVATRRIDYLDVTDFSRQHPYFGYRYKRHDVLNRLVPDAEIPAGTVFLDSPCVKDTGDYAYGIQANVAYMTHPAGSEDGIMVADDFLPKLKLKTFVTKRISWGSEDFAINTYGTTEKPKVMPDLGDSIRADGIVMAIRSKRNPELFVAERSKRACQVVSTSDRKVFAEPGGKVVDIIIHHRRGDTNIAEHHLDEQPQRYYEARRAFHKKLLDVYSKLHRQRGEGLELEDKFHQLIRDSEGVCSDDDAQKVVTLWRNVQMDIYTADITIEYDVLPTIGFKLTDLHGGKGVFCKIVPRNMMPVDENGVSADIVFDPNGTINRANLGRLFEHFMNASGYEFYKQLTALCKIEMFAPKEKTEATVSQMYAHARHQFEEAWAMVMEFYELSSPNLWDKFQQGIIVKNDEDRMEYLAELLSIGWGGWVPVNARKTALQVVKSLRNSRFRPIRKQVSYCDKNGVRHTTKERVRIAEVYMILLEKIGNDGAALATARTHLFGIPAPLSKTNRDSSPIRHQPPRNGEAETRNEVANCGDSFYPEIQDRQNNPDTVRHISRQYLSADNPCDIDNLVDRNKIPYGDVRPLQTTMHLAEVSGIVFDWKDDTR